MVLVNKIMIELILNWIK